MSLLGDVLSALIEQNWRVTLYTFYPYLYRHESIEVLALSAMPLDEWTAPSAELGICIYSKAPNLPLEFDRSPLLALPCRKVGWLMVDEHMSELKSDTQQAYGFGRPLAQTCVGRALSSPHDFLLREPHDNIVLNLFGGGDLNMGMTQRLLGCGSRSYLEPVGGAICAQR